MPLKHKILSTDNIIKSLENAGIEVIPSSEKRNDGKISVITESGEKMLISKEDIFNFDCEPYTPLDEEIRNREDK